MGGGEKIVFPPPPPEEPAIDKPVLNPAHPSTSRQKSSQIRMFANLLRTIIGFWLASYTHTHTHTHTHTRMYTSLAFGVKPIQESPQLYTTSKASSSTNTRIVFVAIG